MKNIFITTLLIFAGLFTAAGSAVREVRDTQTESDPMDGVSVSFPYEIVEGKTRIKVFLGDEPHYFILSTGANTLITKSVQEKFGYPETDPLIVADASGEMREFKRVMIRSLLFENREVNFSGIPAIVGESPVILAGTGASGIIGNDVLSQFIVEIDSREGVVRLLPGSTPLKISLRNMVKFEKNRGSFPVFLIGLDGGATEMVLFDTASPALLTLNRTDNGNTQLPLVTVGMLKISDIEAKTEALPVSLLGAPLLDYGKVTIDYPRSRFFIEPYAI